MSTSSGRDRRGFPRIPLREDGTLTDARGNHWPVHLLDLSFEGARVAVICRHDVAIGEQVSLRIDDREYGNPIEMQGRVVHGKEHLLGLECQVIGVDGRIQLRELLKRSQHSQWEREKAWAGVSCQ